MSKRSIYTKITPLPSNITRETAVETLHNHREMIELNPLVIKHERSKPQQNCPADEFHSIWYELTDRIQYIPGGLFSGKVAYKACFHDLPLGLQTHVYAPAGLEIKEKWTVGGSLSGEPRETVELGLTGVPREGLYLREDVDMRCNRLMNKFVQKTLNKAHGVLVERLLVKADQAEDRKERASYRSGLSSPRQTSFQGAPSIHSATDSWVATQRHSSILSGRESVYSIEDPWAVTQQRERQQEPYSPPPQQSRFSTSSGQSRFSQPLQQLPFSPPPGQSYFSMSHQQSPSFPPKQQRPCSPAQQPLLSPTQMDFRSSMTSQLEQPYSPKAPDGYQTGGHQAARQSMAMGNGEAVHPALRVSELPAENNSPMDAVEHNPILDCDEHPPPAYERPESRSSRLSFERGGSEKLPLPEPEHADLAPAPLRPRSSILPGASQSRSPPSRHQTVFEME